MEWWTHLWLNEGFATWVHLHSYTHVPLYNVFMLNAQLSVVITDQLSTYSMGHMFPDSKTQLSFTKSSSGALRVDAYPTSHPIEVCD